DLLFGNQQGGSFDGRLDLDPSEDRHDCTSPGEDRRRISDAAPRGRATSHRNHVVALRREPTTMTKRAGGAIATAEWQIRSVSPGSHAGDEGAAVGSPDTTRWESLSFPRPWPDRPWIFGVMVASANGVVAWRRGPGDDPVRAILGGDDRPERIADRRLMRYLRTIGDAGIGAQTVREQPGLVLTPQEPGDEPAPDLYAFRIARGLSYHPRNVVYSLYGRLPLEHPIFTTPGLDAVVLTTPAG